jgi:hypothetical protein
MRAKHRESSIHWLKFCGIKSPEDQFLDNAGEGAYAPMTNYKLQPATGDSIRGLPLSYR